MLIDAGQVQQADALLHSYEKSLAWYYQVKGLYGKHHFDFLLRREMYKGELLLDGYAPQHVEGAYLPVSIGMSDLSGCVCLIFDDVDVCTKAQNLGRFYSTDYGAYVSSYIDFWSQKKSERRRYISEEMNKLHG